MSSHFNNKKGFSLIEILVVVAIIGILTGVVVISLSRVKIQGRNSQRSTDISVILNAVYQYALDNNNQLPTTITTTATEICKTAASCTGLVDLSVLTTNQKYLATLPIDPTATSTNSTGYTISKSANNRVIITATKAEGSATISITR